MTWVPVNDAVFVQEHQSERDFGCIEASTRLVELPRTLYLKHQVATLHEFHHKIQSVLFSIMLFVFVVDLLTIENVEIFGCIFTRASHLSLKAAIQCC